VVVVVPVGRGQAAVIPNSRHTCSVTALTIAS
jgi:hypothetical protein